MPLPITLRDFADLFAPVALDLPEYDRETELEELCRLARDAVPRGILLAEILRSACRTYPQRRNEMSAIAKVTEVSAASPNSFEDALRDGLKRASKTIRNIRGAWIKEQKVVVEDDKINEYRVDLKISFLLDD